MEYTTYKIQQGDTLESIAERQGCTVKQLVQFHNQHAEMTQQIYGTHIPLHIEKLYINDEQKKQNSILMKYHLIKRLDTDVSSSTQLK